MCGTFINKARGASRPLRLLLVEDDEDDYIIVRDLLSDLEPSAYEIDWANNYDDGIERLLQGEVDACLLDYRLGARTGMELLREAKHRGCNVPIILLTGQSDRSIDMEAMDAGAVDYLIKNELNPAGIDRTIRYALDHTKAMLKLQELASELEEAHKKALEASQAKTTFLAMISHELRTPLNAILGYTYLLHDELEKLDLQSLAQDVDEIETAGSRLLSLIDELLDISKAEAGKLALHTRAFDVAPLVHEIAATMRPLVSKNSNSLELVCPPTIGQMISDPDRLRQVLVNIVGNACKFTERGHIKLIVSDKPAQPLAQRAAAPASGEELGWLEFRTEDSGIGIAPEQLCAIFEGFTQANPSIAAKYGGSGLGLSISRHLVRLMGGDILADSTYGSGSTFSVLLPRMAPGEQAPPG